MKSTAELPHTSHSNNTATASITQRVNAVDLLRGIVMVIMLLDHTREFIHREVLNFEPTDLTKTNTLLFYIGQWITVHVLAMLAGYAAGQPIGWLFTGLLDRPATNPGNLGFSLWVVYGVWFLGLLLLYPICRWFADVKRRRKDWWLSYL